MITPPVVIETTIVSPVSVAAAQLSGELLGGIVVLTMNALP